ncbi:uncharacterized protein [Macrobrachium rosenbergii]|uniref:uncharacterized protein n=1 Tax=Macrobrachium rosenbergii TaxID=79674 RepID=UPI0034D39B55
MTIEWLPPAHITRALPRTEARYSTFDRELCTVYWAVRHFKFLLEGTPFTIYTDHQPLVHTFTKQGDTWSSRQQRHLAAIAEFTCSVKYLPGRKNPVADALSRIELNAVQLGINYEDLAREQAANPETPAYRTAIRSLKWKDVSLAPRDPNLLCDVSTGQPRPLVPTSHRRQVFDIIHGLSHPSVRTMAKLLTEKFVWHGMQKEVRTWARQGPAFLSELWSALASLLGTAHRTTTAYNPAANGLVERFHRSLKASLMARCTTGDWKYQLLWVLLELRTAPRANGDLSAAEKIYGEPLVVPGELVTEDRHNPSVQRLSNIVGKFAPCKRTYTGRSVAFTPPGLSSTTHVFVRDDAVRPSLTRPYRGPFLVLERNNKAFRLALRRKDDWMSVNCIKPSLLEEDTDVTALHPLPEQSSP